MIVLSENLKSLNSCFLNFNMCNNCLDVSLLKIQIHRPLAKIMIHYVRCGARESAFE